MKHPFQTLIGAAAAVAIVFAASAAQAQATKEETKCHATIGKNIAKYQAALAKNLTGCHKARNAGKAPTTSSTDCNNAIDADLKGKRASARQKAIDGVNKSCNDTVALNVRAQYVRCPSPATTSDDGGATDGIDDFTELTTCLLDVSEAYVEYLGKAAMGTPDVSTTLSKEQQKCHQTFGKGLSKIIKTVGKTYTKCQATQEKNGGTLDYGACIAGGDTKGKVAATFTKSKDGLDKACLDSLVSYDDYGQLGMCGGSLAGAKACYDRIVDPSSRGLVAASMELPATTCSAGADVIINARSGARKTDTRLDSGYTGLSHNVDVLDGYVGAVLISGCDADCENCDVRIDPAAGNCRCENDPTIKCDQVAAADAVNCGGNTCNCFFGPPLALNASNTPVCVANKFTQDFTGGTSVVGSYDVGTRARALVHLGIGQLQPCPTCDGDPTPNDGVLGGTCDGGPRNGLGCDVNAEHPTFGTSSFDCPPDSGANVTGAGLNLGLQFTDGTSSITAAVGGAFCDSTGPCHCSQCTADASVGCASDSDCDDAAVAEGGSPGDKGTCGVDLSPSNPVQSQCTGGEGNCVVDADGLGLCDAGPFDTYCSGAPRADGSGVLTCADNADCVALNPSCPGGDCGTCDLFGQRRCLGPNVSATGDSGIFNSQGVSTFCSAKTGNAGVNAAGGLPGPGRVSLDFDFNIYCDAAHTTVMHLPGGSNCP